MCQHLTNLTHLCIGFMRYLKIVFKSKKKKIELYGMEKRASSYNQLFKQT